MYASCGLIPCSVAVLVLMLLPGNIHAQELAHFNKSSGVDFEKENVYAEIMPGAKTQSQSTATTLVKNMTDSTELPLNITTKSVEIRADGKDLIRRTASWVGLKAVPTVQSVGQIKQSTPDQTGSTTTQAVTSTDPQWFSDTQRDDFKDNQPPYITWPISQDMKVVAASGGRDAQGKRKANRVTFLCEADANPAPLFLWRRNGIEVSGEYGSSFTNGSLIFPDFTDKANGYYQCEALNKFGKATSVLLPIFAAIEPHDRNDPEKPLTTTEGKNYTIPCGEVPRTLPPYLYKWYQDKSSEYQVSDRVGFDTKGDLHFAYTMKSDSSDYSCALAPNDFGTSIKLYNHVDLTVHSSDSKDDFAPGPMSHTVNAKGLIGKEFIFECFFSGKPVPSVTWKNTSNHDITTGDPLYEVFDFGRKLRVKSVRQEDEGFFKCTGSNHLASEEVEMQLNVTAPPMRLNEGTLRTHIEPDGKDFTLKCRARAAAGENLESPLWFRNGERLRAENFPDPSRYSFSEDMTELKITDLRKIEDTASFQCNISNTEGYLWMNGYLRVIHSIQITKKPDSIIESKTNDTQGYDISVLAKGDNCCILDYQYYFNNTQLSAERLSHPPFSYDATTKMLRFMPSSLPKAALNDWMGSFACRVSNPHDETVVGFTIMEYKPLPVVAPANTQQLWWIGLLCGIIAILIVVVIVLVIYKRKTPGDTYQLEKTELKHNLNPQQDILNQSFQEI